MEDTQNKKELEVNNLTEFNNEFEASEAIPESERKSEAGAEAVPEEFKFEEPKKVEETIRTEVAQPTQAQPTQPQTTRPKGVYYDRVESILEEGLNDFYNELPEAIKPAFKQKGEETTAKIDQLLQTTKFKIKDIVNLILEWLRMIPGVNKFFIEKEASIKAKKIIKIKNNS